jgi:hypothetical protein
MGKKSGSGSGMNIPDHISESLETFFGVKILKFFDADLGSGINIPDPQHCYILKQDRNHPNLWIYRVHKK